MQGTIKLITPPDFFETGDLSILLVHLSDQEQDAASQWLAKSNFNQDLNIYVYDGEHNISWFLYAAARCEHKYLNLDSLNLITQSLSGYLLGRQDFYYHTENDQVAEIYSHISQNRVSSIEGFLETVLGG
jgi:hypothetical protein